MSALLRAFGEEAGSTAAHMVERDAAATARVLAALYARGRMAHPGLAVGEEAFGRYLARCVDGGSAGRATPLGDLAAEDLYLACACAARLQGAAAAFEQKCGGAIRRAVSRVLATRDEQQAAEQRAWEYLIVEECGGPPRIGQYLGRAPLEKWVSVASMRLAITLGRTESTERRLRDKTIAEVAGVDADVLSKEGDLRAAFDGAVSDALGQLKARERLVLKLFLVSGMTLDAIGKSLGITRQAASKTIARARENIIKHVKASVQESLQMSKEDLASVLRHVASQLDGTISRVLEKDQEPKEKK
jgi:RNA polymerase sigma-70 factor (ECF subfamily)